MYRFLVGGLSDARSMIRARVGLSHTLKRFADDATVRIHNRQEPSRTAVGKDAIAKEFRRLHAWGNRVAGSGGLDR
jgi:hypothetical protein